MNDERIKHKINLSKSNFEPWNDVIVIFLSPLSLFNLDHKPFPDPIQRK
jgi:hypothetical protein